MKTFLRSGLPIHINSFFKFFLQKRFPFVIVYLLAGITVTNAQTISNVTVSGAPVCAGSTIDVNFNANNGAAVFYTSATVYTVYLSSSTGGAPYNSIGTFTSTATYNTNPSGTTAITGTVTIPFATATSANYKVSVGSGTPAFNGSGGANASASFTVNAPTVSIMANPGTTICANTSVTFTATPTNATNPTYQWQVNGSNIPGATGSTYTTTTLANTNQINVVMTSVDPCASNPTVSSNTLTMTVNNSAPVSVTIVSSDADNSICAGASVTFTATPTNGGTTPVYQWFVGASPVGTNSSTYTTTALTTGQVVTVRLTSNATCATGNPATSNAITTTVNPNLPVSVSIASSDADDVICGGASVTFTATPTNGGASPVYQWFVGATAVGTNSPTYTTTTLTTGQVVTVRLTSNAVCATGSPATSNAITTTVNPNLPASVSIISSDADNTICAGNSVTFTATPVNGGTPSYQWQSDGSNIPGATGATYTTTGLTTGESIRVIMTSTATCATGSPATSNAIATTVNPNLPASVTIVSSDADNNICAGASVTFTATPTNGGTPSYQWQLNGSNISGATGSTYTTSGLTNGQSIRVIMTSTATCATGSPATSNAIATTVNPNVAASVSIVSSDADNIICGGTSVTFTATPTNGGTPGYQWQLNGTDIVGATGATYTTAALTSGQSIRVVMTSTATCATGSPATSSAIVTTVNPNLPASVSIVSNDADNTICTGTSVTFTATPVNGGTPTYQWQLNGGNISGATGSTYTTSALTNGQSINVVMTSTATCATGSPATSNVITTTVNPNLPVSVTVSSTATTICAGGSVTFTATPTNGGNSPSFQWQVNGVNAGTNSNIFTTTTLTNGSVVKVILTSDAAPCATGSPATSNSISVTVNPNLPASVAISSNDADNTICTGATVVFTATPTNGGASPSYQWQVNGSNVGSNSNTYTTASLANGDVVKVIMTSNASPCSTGSPATSSNITMVVNAQPSISLSSATGSDNQQACRNSALPTNITYLLTNATNATVTGLPPGVGGSYSAGTYTISGTPTSNGTYNYTVTTVSGCTNVSASGTITVINSNPQNIGGADISGPTSVCPLATGLVYSVNAITGATSYTFVFPAGWTITAGSGTRTVTVTATGSITPGTNVLTVFAVNACGTSSRTYSINVGSFAATNVGADISTCNTSPVSLTAILQGAASGVVWTAPSGTFDNNASLTPMYTPAIASGSVTIRATTNDPAGSCNATFDELVLTINQPPNITSHPVAVQNSCSGGSASFSVAATGTNLTYQWRKDGVAIPGATASTYTVTNVTTANSGSYTVVVSGGPNCAPVTSTASVLTVNQVVAITSQPPATQTVCSGTDVTLTVTATGSGLTYQWKKNGTDISGATSSSLTLTNVTSANAGTYTVVVTGMAPCSPLTSANSVLVVNDAVAITAQPVATQNVGSSRVDLQACKLEYSIVSPK